MTEPVRNSNAIGVISTAKIALLFETPKKSPAGIPDRRLGGLTLQSNDS